MAESSVNNSRCQIRVVVRETEGECKIIHDRIGDHNDRYFRDWVAKTAWWALRNGKSVLTYPIE